MISGVFVDRPRLAIVIAIVTTLAGLLALLRIPVAQFPDIVPPQVSVQATYPGASAAVVEATVAQIIESAVNGVENMIYMRSNSANDGTYRSASPSRSAPTPTSTRSTSTTASRRTSPGCRRRCSAPA